MANGVLGGKLAFVTGAGSGIGRAACQVLAREGAKVIATDKDEKSAQKTLSLLKSSSATFQHLHFPLDVSRSEEVYSVVKSAIEHFSVPPSIVVNCAGITRDNFLLKLDEDSFQQVIDVNLKGTFLVTQTIARALVEANITGASVINLASIVGRTGNIGQCSYAASKAGIEAFTKTTAKELGNLSPTKLHCREEISAVCFLGKSNGATPTTVEHAALPCGISVAKASRALHRQTSGEMCTECSTRRFGALHRQTSGEMCTECSTRRFGALHRQTSGEMCTECFGIRCNVVVPGFIDTPMTDAVPDKVKEKFRATIALKRFGRAEEVAEVIAFLASDKSSYVNGASIEVIGG
uniref:Estradiol 17-beta-dehydrogenase 8 n=1 Tax=Timema genevievae TaxID=629358 RepID=A0A7R9PNU5_TIMGE|nr:unnamed protein product [Timema genevievae]